MSGNGYGYGNTNGNQALAKNYIVGQLADLTITDHGSNWYFTVAAVMTVSALAFTGLSLAKPVSNRFFHQAAAAFCFIAAIGYFSAASGLGQVPILAEFQRSDSSQVGGAGTREIFYVRYIDYAVSLPLIVLALMLSSGVPLSSTLVTMLAAEIFNVCLLVGGLTQTVYKFGYLVFAIAAEWFVFYQLLFPARKYASAIGGSVSSTYLAASLVTVVVWLFYPIAWGLSEGGNVIHPDSEAIFYGILDIFAKPIVGLILIFGHRNTDFATLGYPEREPGAAHGEKTAGAPAGGVSNGAGTA
jgi:bacteriorhodopsin